MKPRLRPQSEIEERLREAHGYVESVRSTDSYDAAVIGALEWGGGAR